eukprot:GILJ01010847.1.p1 GENE.GILJ01010847.1~~GILJ01010847.1.p1  ORF type:complete len:1320 (+),score=209.23 GILJ01010847.1:152-4111(+)
MSSTQNQTTNNAQAIQVCVRVRPLNPVYEKEDAWVVDQHNHSIHLLDTQEIRRRASLAAAEAGSPDLPSKRIVPRRASSYYSYTFDHIFGRQQTTSDVYNHIGSDLTRSVLDGYNGTVFAYGQTTSGKTYTMIGVPQAAGFVPLAVQDVFQQIAQSEDRQFSVWVSYMEIYNEVINDLLVPGSINLKIREDAQDGVSVSGLKMQRVLSVEDVMSLLELGERHRHYRATHIHEHSSRSHTIFRLFIESKTRNDLELDPNTNLPLRSAIKFSTLNLVDLAGSERISESGASSLGETGHINKSLFVLANVINKLAEGRRGHVPYRDSKLTRILQSALGGNSLTVIICTVSPALANVNLTHSTLRFASRAKTIKNKPQVNELTDDRELVNQYRQQIEVLERRLQEAQHELETSRRKLNYVQQTREDDNIIESLRNQVAATKQQLASETNRVQELEHELTTGSRPISEATQELLDRLQTETLARQQAELEIEAMRNHNGTAENDKINSWGGSSDIITRIIHELEPKLRHSGGEISLWQSEANEILNAYRIESLALENRYQEMVLALFRKCKGKSTPERTSSSSAAGVITRTPSHGKKASWKFEWSSQRTPPNHQSPPQPHANQHQTQQIQLQDSVTDEFQVSSPRTPVSRPTTELGSNPSSPRVGSQTLPVVKSRSNTPTKTDRQSSGQVSDQSTAATNDEVVEPLHQYNELRAEDVPDQVSLVEFESAVNRFVSEVSTMPAQFIPGWVHYLEAFHDKLLQLLHDEGSMQEERIAHEYNLQVEGVRSTIYSPSNRSNNQTHEEDELPSLARIQLQAQQQLAQLKQSLDQQLGIVQNLYMEAVSALEQFEHRIHQEDIVTDNVTNDVAVEETVPVVDEEIEVPLDELQTRDSTRLSDHEEDQDDDEGTEAWSEEALRAHQTNERTESQLNLLGLFKQDTVAGNTSLWGFGKDGRCGHGDESCKSIPHFLRQSFAKVICGYHHSAAITDQGDLYTWGRGISGQLGHGNVSNVRLPSLVQFFKTQHKVYQVACGWQHTTAVTDTGFVFTWGFGGDGQLGHGDGEDYVLPRQVEQLTSKVCQMVACGHSHTAALTASGLVYIWGCNPDGRLMLGNFRSQHSPRLIAEMVHTKVVHMALGVTHTALVTGEGEVWTSGSCEGGQLGYSCLMEQPTPQRVAMFGRERRATQVSCGDGHTLVLVDSGEVYAFGKGTYGRLGIGDDTNQIKPRLISSLKNKVIVQVNAGGRHSACVADDGSLYCWGFGFYQQLGVGDDLDYAIPKRVKALADKRVLSVSCGYFHTGAVTIPRKRLPSTKSGANQNLNAEDSTT